MTSQEIILRNTIEAINKEIGDLLIDIIPTSEIGNIQHILKNFENNWESADELARESAHFIKQQWNQLTNTIEEKDTEINCQKNKQGKTSELLNSAYVELERVATEADTYKKLIKEKVIKEKEKNREILFLKDQANKFEKSLEQNKNELKHVTCITIELKEKIKQCNRLKSKVYKKKGAHTKNKSTDEIHLESNVREESLTQNSMSEKINLLNTIKSECEKNLRQFQRKNSGQRNLKELLERARVNSELAKKFSDLDYKQTDLSKHCKEHLECAALLTRATNYFEKKIKLPSPESSLDEILISSDEESDIINQPPITSTPESNYNIPAAHIEPGRSLATELQTAQNQIQENLEQEPARMDPYDVAIKRINALIPNFSGESNTNKKFELQRFLDCCDGVHQSFAADSQELNHFLAALKTKFIGPAYGLVNSAEINSYAELKRLLTETYLPKKSMAELNKLFYGCTQGLEEPTSEYFRRLKGHLHEIMENLTATFGANPILRQTQEVEAVNIFKRGSNNIGLRRQLIMDTSATLAELEVVVNQYEKAEKQITAGMSFDIKEERINTVGQPPQQRSYNSPQYNQNENRRQSAYNSNNQSFYEARGRPQINNNMLNHRFVKPNNNYNAQYNSERPQWQEKNTVGFNDSQQKQMAANRKCEICNNFGHGHWECGMLKRMCSICKSFDHTISRCPHNINNQPRSYRETANQLHQSQNYGNNQEYYQSQDRNQQQPLQYPTIPRNGYGQSGGNQGNQIGNTTHETRPQPGYTQQFTRPNASNNTQENQLGPKYRPQAVIRNIEHQPQVEAQNYQQILCQHCESGGHTIANCPVVDLPRAGNDYVQTQSAGTSAQ